MSKRFFHALVTLAFAGLLFLSAAAYLPDIITVSSTPGGLELPIYCVETEKPQIAISFDAAWGNDDTQTIQRLRKCSKTLFSTQPIHRQFLTFLPNTM